MELNSSWEIWWGEDSMLLEVNVALRRRHKSETKQNESTKKQNAWFANDWNEWLCETVVKLQSVVNRKTFVWALTFHVPDIRRLLLASSDRKPKRFLQRRISENPSQLRPVIVKSKRSIVQVICSWECLTGSKVHYFATAAVMDC